MPTIRQLILCASPISPEHTIREHLDATNCDDLGSGGLVVNSQLVKIKSTGIVKIEVEDDIIPLKVKDDIVLIRVEDDIIKIKETGREVIDVVC